MYWKIGLTIVDGSNKTTGGRSASAIPFHAWLERDDEGQTGIARQKGRPPDIRATDRKTDMGTLSCGREAIVVTAYDASHSDVELCGQAGSGPVRAGNSKKPDISAPGVKVWLVRSQSDTGYVLQSGTSLAAPFVTGTIACMFEVDRTADLATIKGALFETTRHGRGNEHGTEWSEHLGWGRLNPRAAVNRLKPGRKV